MTELPPKTVKHVELLEKFGGSDLHDLCDAADAAIEAGGGFGWVKPPERHIMERYWRGVLVVPERRLLVARLDGVIAASLQLVKTVKNNEAQAHAAQITANFTAPWARRYGLAKMLIQVAEKLAIEDGIKLLNLDVRDTQTAAISLYERIGFTKWASHPYYAVVKGQFIKGNFYYKLLDENISGA
ncbi:MAG: GNAT family N-acetyltransferase [Alphaproteobacteria bacterium]